MKTLLVFLFIVFAYLSCAQAQNRLANTAWQGQVNAPDLTNVIFHFKADSVYMYIAPDMFIGETMAYTTESNTLKWRKTSGNSPCDTKTTGTYQFAIKDDELTIKLIADDCPARKEAWMDKPFKKVAIPVK